MNLLDKIELFFDKNIILNKSNNIIYKLNKPTFKKCVLKVDQEYEGGRDNYYTIIKLTQLHSQITNYATEFEQLISYIVICQTITFMALAFSLYFVEPIFEANTYKNRCQLILLFVSYVWKILATICLYNVLYVLYDEAIPDELFCKLMQLSYMLIFWFIFIIIVSLLGMSLGFMVLVCNICIDRIIKWSNILTISLITETPNDGSEDL